MRTASLLLVVMIAGTVAAQDVISLENSSLRVQWDTDSGSLVSLKDKPSDREWLGPTSKASLYSIQLADSRTFSASSSRQTSVWKRDGTVIVECIHDEPKGLAVTCRFWFEEESGQLLGRIGIRSPEPCQIAEVRFPVVTLGLPFSGSGAEDRILWPECDGTMLLNPSENRVDRQFKYPGSASMQMVAAFDPTAGLCLSARDSRAHRKMFCTWRRGRAVEMNVTHVLPQTAQTEWELPYDVALAGLKPSKGLERITWEAAADVYRQWAIEQPWCRQTMAQRVGQGDIPKWLVEPTLLLTFSLRGRLADGSVGNRLPVLVEQVERWSKVMGVPVTSLIISWEKLDTWTTPDYFPPYGGESEFLAATRKFHAGGHRAMVFLSGLYWTLEKNIAHSDRPPVQINQRAEFDRRGRASAVSDADGEAVLRGKPDSGIGQAATICPSTELAREILVGTSRRCRELGIDLVQVDQLVGGGMAACYHPKHDHPPGGGTWCSKALYDLFSEIRKEGKRADPDFAFAIEEPGEFYLPILDTYHARDLHQGRWPRSGAGVLGVPLFTHVYHDYLSGYGSEGCYASERASRFAVYQIGMNLVCGKIPAVALWSRWCDPEKLDPTQLRSLRAHLELWRGPAGEFLNYGQRVASPDLDVPPMALVLTEKDGKTKRELTFPSVLHSAWKLADGRGGTVFACVHDEPVEFGFGQETIRLEPGGAAFRTSQ